MQWVALPDPRSTRSSLPCAPQRSCRGPQTQRGGPATGVALCRRAPGCGPADHADQSAVVEQVRDDAEQKAEIERLTHENIRLRAGAVWPERLTGAGIVLFGMVVGAIVAGRSKRQRNAPRIKL